MWSTAGGGRVLWCGVIAGGAVVVLWRCRCSRRNVSGGWACCGLEHGDGPTGGKYIQGLTKQLSMREVMYLEEMSGNRCG